MRESCCALKMFHSGFSLKLMCTVQNAIAFSVLSTHFGPCFLDTTLENK